MPLNRRELLGGLAASTLLGPSAVRAGTATHPQYLIVFVARGGWDPTFAFDPKFSLPLIDGPDIQSDPDDPDDVEAVQTFGNIPIVVNDLKRPSVSAYFDKWHGQTAVVNGLWTKAIAHHTCLLRVLTGTGNWANPDFPTIVGSVLGKDLPLGSVDFTGMSNRGQLGSSAGRIGLRNQLKSLVDPSLLFPEPRFADYSLPIFSPSELQRNLVREYLDGRIGQFEAARGDGAWNTQNAADMRESIRRAQQLVELSPEALEDLPFGEQAAARLQLQISIQLLKVGVCRAVTIDHQFPWDTHNDNLLQHDNYNDYFETLDMLCTELQAEGMLDQTLVVACSEMGRSAKLNVGGGKDHWAHTSILFVGGGVEGNRVFGGTTDALESEPIDLASGEVFAGGIPLAYDSMVAGVVQSMDVDPAPWFPGIEPYVGPLPS